MTLHELPLDVLLALQEAMTDPTRSGAERARLRAAEAGFHLQLGNAVNDAGQVVLAPPPPLALPEADTAAAADPTAVKLSLGSSSEP